MNEILLDKISVRVYEIFIQGFGNYRRKFGYTVVEGKRPLVFNRTKISYIILIWKTSSL